jgi:signal peptidase II
VTAPARPWRLAALVSVAVLVLDQVTKAVVRGSIDRGEVDEVTSFFDLVHVRNDGVAFGALGGSGLVIVLVAAALVALLVYFTTHADKPLMWLPTGMLLGGAIGNIVDRVRLGAVTDFLKFPQWPAFNVADIFVTVGVFVLLWVIERDARAAERTTA